MATGKILNLGGIDNRPPKANQSLGRFRVARNVYPTPDGRLIPRYDNEEAVWAPLLDQVPNFTSLSNYNNSVLSTVTYAQDHPYGNLFEARLDSLIIPKNFRYFPGSGVEEGKYYSQNTMTYRRNNTTYILSPDISSSLKYDGVEIGRMADAQATLYTPNKSTTAPLKYIKVIAHSIDFDNNEVWSAASTFSMANGTTTLTLQSGFYGSANVPNVITPGGIKYGEESGDAANCFRCTAAGYSSVDKQFSVFPLLLGAVNTTILDQSQVGSYVFVKISEFATSSIISSSNISNLNLTQNCYGLALKIIALNGDVSFPSIILDTKDAYVLDSNREWIKLDLDYSDSAKMIALGNSITFGVKQVASIWAAQSEFGIYYYQGIIPVFPKDDFTPTNYNITIPATPTAANAATGFDTKIIDMSRVLNDIYDPLITPVSPNAYQKLGSSGYNFGGNWLTRFYCMTVYQDLLLMANDDLIWFSNSSLAGSFEQFAALNFLKVGDSEYGRITSICATNDFLIVSRERKNYYVNGNIATGNYRVQEIEQIEVGAWSNSSTIVVKDTVVMLTALGIYAISDGGRCVKLSDKCPKNFTTFDAVNTNEDVSFKIDGTIAYPKNPNDVEDYSGITIAYDEYRDLLIFMQRKEGNPCFVLKVEAQEFYEWDGMLSVPNYFVNSICCIEGKYYLGSIYDDIQFGQLPSTWNAKIYVEDKTAALSYVNTHPVKLYTSWLTAGEPSLEKILLQLKMFGRVQSQGSSKSINIVHFKDWDYVNKITNAPYFPNNTALDLNDQVQYSHKKRLNSDKVLAASVGLEVEDSDVTFELESIEVEFNTIQEGMKK